MAAVSMETNNMCDVDPAVAEKMKKLRFSKKKTSAAIIVKIDVKEKRIVIDEELEDISIEELQEELPERNPRYVMYSYEQKYDDGRVTYPLCLIYFCPEGCKSEVSMLYAGSKMSVVNISGATKVFEVREKEMLTKDWLQEKVKFFR